MHEVHEDQEEQLTVPHLFASFKKWMVSPDGGKKDIKTAKQHAAQLRKVLEQTGQQENPNALLDFKLIRDKFVTEYAEVHYEAQTIKSYIMSIRHFLSFVLSEEPNEISATKDQIVTLEEKMRRWAASYKKSTKKRVWQRMEEDIAKIITPEDVRKFETSKAARNAITLLGKLSGAHMISITQQNFTLVRDFLMTEILLNNACRAGVIANVSLSEFRRKVTMCGTHVVRVREHKGAASHGPAALTLNQSLYSWLQLYVSNVRSQVCGVDVSDGGSLFVTWIGKKMSSNQVTQCLQSVWKKAGCHGKPCTNIIRKTAVTRSREVGEHMSNDLADLMAHRVETANKHYKLVQKTKTAVKAATELHNIMRTNYPEESSSSKMKQSMGKNSYQATSTTPIHVSDRTSQKQPVMSEDVHQVLSPSAMPVVHFSESSTVEDQ